MAREANSPELKAAFETHRQETEGQVERLQQIFELLDKPARGKTCDAILGIIEEGKEVMEDFGESPALDAGLVAAAQAVEHYEIARYGTLKTWAGQLGMKDAAALLEKRSRPTSFSAIWPRATLIKKLLEVASVPLGGTVFTAGARCVSRSQVRSVQPKHCPHLRRHAEAVWPRLRLVLAVDRAHHSCRRRNSRPLPRTHCFHAFYHA